MSERRRPFANGEDVIVVLPSGRQVAGRTDGALGRHRVFVALDDCQRVPAYPWSWVYAWEDAPEPMAGDLR